MKIDIENPQAVLEDILTRMNKGEIVQRKSGVWEYVDDIGYRCSVCHTYAYGCLGEVIDGHYKFCPFCGAKMVRVECEGKEKDI